MLKTYYTSTGSFQVDEITPKETLQKDLLTANTTELKLQAIVKYLTVE